MHSRQALSLVALLTLGSVFGPSAQAGPQSWQVDLQRADPTKPTLIHWQRSIEDARALSQLTGRPMLVCVNLDGESASEAFAHGKYKDATFAALVDAFVPVVANPVRHNDADHDEQGRRIVCPRFGRVTCGEHVAAEPQAFELYFEGERVVPRHIGVAPDGSVLFDLKLLQDLSVVDRTLSERASALAEARWTKPFATPDASARAELEDAYLAGDAALRAELLRAAAGSPYRPYDLLRLGLADEAPELRALAAKALAATAAPGGLELLLAAYDDGSLAAERGLLEAAVTRLASADPAAARALRARKSLANASTAIDVAAWRNASDAVPVEAKWTSTPEELGRRLDELQAAGGPSDKDGARLLEVARTSLAFAELEIQSGNNPTFFLMDAASFGERAAAAGADAGQAAAVRARAAWLMGESDRAAEQAASALPSLVAQPPTREALELLDVLAQARTRQVYAAMGAGGEWDVAQAADALAAYEVLRTRADAQERHVTELVDLLVSFDLGERAVRVLREGLARWPASVELHNRLRAQVAAREGIDAFTRVYADLRAETSEPAAIDWFAGYAELVTAEYHARSEGLERTEAAYLRSIEAFERSLSGNDGYRDSVDHYVALALMGRAQVALQARELERAAELVVASLERRPATADLPDGLERTPRGTAGDVRKALQGSGRQDLVTRLDQRLEVLGTPVATDGQQE